MLRAFRSGNVHPQATSRSTGSGAVLRGIVDRYTRTYYTLISTRLLPFIAVIASLYALSPLEMPLIALSLDDPPPLA